MWPVSTEGRVLSSSPTLSIEHICEILFLDQIKGSPYMETDGQQIPDYRTSNIGVFWDFENMSIPSWCSAKTILKGVEDVLRQQNYYGEHFIIGYGNVDQFKEEKFQTVAADMHIFHVPKAYAEESLPEARSKSQGNKLQECKLPKATHGKTKDSADKKIIASSMSWLLSQLFAYEEPQVVALISIDVDFLPAIKEMRHKDFHVIKFLTRTTTMQKSETQ